MSGASSILVAPAGEFAAFAADCIASILRTVAGESGVCSIALAGGETPRPVYQALAAEPFRTGLPWGRVSFYFGDERFVPPGDARSNYRAARESLFEPLGVSGDRVFRMRGEADDRDGAAIEYEDLLPRPLDLLILGMGADGHTASLFPGQTVLDAVERRVVVVNGPKPPPWRMTITPPVIRAARRVVVLVRGSDKADAVRRVLEGPENVRALPAQLARGRTWVLDADAAGALRSATD